MEKLETGKSPKGEKQWVRDVIEEMSTGKGLEKKGTKDGERVKIKGEKRKGFEETVKRGTKPSKTKEDRQGGKSERGPKGSKIPQGTGRREGSSEGKGQKGKTAGRWVAAPDGKEGDPWGENKKNGAKNAKK